MNDCTKCGSEDIATTFVEPNEDMGFSSKRERDSEFVKVKSWGCVSAKEHLFKVCRNCQYFWREDCLDNIKVRA